jgi:hypothetical protein
MAMNPRLLRPTASGFNPKSIAGLEAWYAADVASSITIATGVQQWADLSGKGRHLIQNTTNNQPAYNSVTLNGKATVTFDGTNDLLRSDAFAFSQPYTFFGVFRFEAAYVSGGPRVFDGGDTSTSRSGEVFRGGPGDDMRMYSGPGGSTVVGNTAPSGSVQAFNIWDFEFNSSSSVLRYRKNVYTVTGSIGGNAFTRVTVGAGGGLAGNSANVSVAELLLFSRSMPTADADKIRSYLGKKYNLAYQA